MEIERKFLVDKDLLPPLGQGIRIEQHYLNDIVDKWLVRLRQWNDDYFLELKTQGDLSREELKFKITREEYLEGIKHSIKKLRKTRYLLQVQPKKITDEIELSYEIDIYDDYDFVTCEVEFETEEEAKEFVPPHWCTEDVTDDYKYRNNNLAK